ncbi:MAG: mechanosensitive ion channel protein MscS [Gallionellales bacterium GWA2_59_43]|nr:MAG: mechanosensitive ion channel protein MscS [Gallionellales bacterium GWA2_59_43]
MDSLPFAKYLNVSKDLLHVIVILALAWLLMQISRKLIRMFRNYMNTRSDSAEEGRRIETLARVFRYISTVVISLVAGMLALSELGISIAPILGAAGVVGIAVGFGAQSLIKDYFNGFFMLLENQIRQGDVVEVCNKTGIVEDITLRYVCLRDNEGSVHYVPNGQITTVTNKSRDYAQALIDVSVAYRENIDDVVAVLREVGSALRADPVVGPMVLEDIEIQGVQDLADSAMILRCRFKTVALEQWNVRRAFLGRLKPAFDAHGIEIPYPHLTVYAGQDKQGNAPAFRIAGTVPENSQPGQRGASK